MLTNFNDCSIAMIQMSLFVIKYQLSWSLADDNYISKILNNNY